MKNNILEQMVFCLDLAERVGKAVKAHEEYREAHRTKEGTKLPHSWCALYGSGITEKGASKIQIQASIVQLRRELMALSRMFEEE